MVCKVFANVLRWRYKLDNADLLLQKLDKDSTKRAEFMASRQSWIDWRNDRAGGTGQSEQAGGSNKRRRIRAFGPAAAKDETDDDEPDLPSTVGHRRENMIRVTESLGNLWPIPLYIKKFRRTQKKRTIIEQS